MENQPQPNRGFDIAADNRTGFRNSHMKRIICFRRKNLMCLYTHQHIGRFNADYHIFISLLFNHMYLVKGALHNPFCGYPVVLFYQLFFKRTAVYPYPDRDIPFFRHIYHPGHLILPSDISGIYSDFISAVFHGGNRHLIIKMNIRNKRNRNLFLNLTNCCRRLRRRNRTSDNFTACLFQFVNLLHCSFDILCPCICHGLY